MENKDSGAKPPGFLPSSATVGMLTSLCLRVLYGTQEVLKNKNIYCNFPGILKILPRGVDVKFLLLPFSQYVLLTCFMLGTELSARTDS